MRVELEKSSRAHKKLSPVGADLVLRAVLLVDVGGLEHGESLDPGWQADAWQGRGKAVRPRL